MLADLPIITLEQQAIIDLLAVYKRNHNDDDAYKDLACLWLLERSHSILDQDKQKLLDAIANYLNDSEYHDFVKQTILAILIEKYPQEKSLTSESSVAKILAWGETRQANISSIGLSSHTLIHFDEFQWRALGKVAEKLKLKHLMLEDEFYKFLPHQWQTFGENFQAAEITLLVISCNELAKISPEAASALGTAIRVMGVTELDLGINELSNLAVESLYALAAGLAGIKLKLLDLASNELFEMNDTQLQALGVLLQAVQAESLNLEDNELFRFTAKKLQALAMALQLAGTKMLGLRHNELNKLTLKQWQILGTSFQLAGLKSLSLADNDLYQLTSEGWQGLCDMIQAAKIEELDLCYNDLSKLTPEQWQALAVALRAAGVKILNLRKNGIEQLPTEARQNIYKVLRNAGVLKAELEMAPDQPLDYDYWLVMLQNNCEAAFKHMKQGGYQLTDMPYLLAEQGFTWPETFNDEILTEFVKRLESSGDPQDKLIAGLLVLGFCNNFVAQDNPIYWEKRIQDGISLLLQAADPGAKIIPLNANKNLEKLSLDGEISHLLWHFKVTQAEDFPSVAKRLNQLWLKPAIINQDCFSKESPHLFFSLPNRQERKLVQHAEQAIEEAVKFIPGF